MGNEEVLEPVDEAEDKAGEEVGFYGRNLHGDFGDRYGIDDDLKNPEDYAIEDDEREAHGDDLERQGEEFEHRFDDAVQNAHHQPAERKECRAAGVSDFFRQKIGHAIERACVDNDTEDEVFDHGADYSTPSYANAALLTNRIYSVFIKLQAF